MSPVFGVGEVTTRLQRQPNMPDLPQKVEDVIVYLHGLERAIVDMTSIERERLQRYLQDAGDEAFGSAQTTATITFGTPLDDAEYGVHFGGSWNTVLWYSNKTTAGFTINASAAPGGAGGTVHWLVRR